MSQFEFVIPADHPSLAGHFPGHPVVPGVVILDALHRGLREHDPSLLLEAISSVKFIRPIEPGMPISVTISERKPLLLDFSCEAGAKLMAKGTLRVRQENK